MRTDPLLRNLRHRAMIAPVSPLRTRLIHISPTAELLDNLSFAWNYSPTGTVHRNGIQIQCPTPGWSKTAGIKGHIKVCGNICGPQREIPLQFGDWFAVPADLMFAVRLTQCWIRG